MLSVKMVTIIKSFLLLPKISMLMDEKELQISTTLPMAVVQDAHVRKHMHVTSRQGGGGGGGGEWTFFFFAVEKKLFCFIVFLYMSAGCVSTIRT